MKNRLPTLLSVIFTLALWKIFSILIGSQIILPSPEKTFFCMASLFKKVFFWQNIFFTLCRIYSAFFLTVILGVILGFFSGKSAFFNSFLAFPLSILKTTPVAALILILLFAFNSSTIPFISAILMCLPVMTECTAQGIKNDKKNIKMYEMARIFEFSKGQKFFFIFLPNFRSFFYSGLVSVFGMTWKVVAAGEIITVPKYAVGSFLYKNQIALESAQVFAMTIYLIIFSYTLESILKWILKSKI
ncbi:ABC transporter permease [Treponema pectinovorum]|uniref:ABC transporter permease n=1 Tax=Treponema pectinovorum TaxID=164 RepID=UPI0011CC3C0A|nr:ABC transporter permease subunit [Treponema pectinovorum]